MSETVGGHSRRTSPSILLGTGQFTETPSARLRRWVLGAAYAVRGKRIRMLPHVLLGTLCLFLFGEEDRSRGAKERTLHGEAGLAAVSDDLSVPALVAAYREGLFPLCHIGPMKWWCPETRAVLDPMQSHVSKKVKQLLRAGKFTVTFDEDFAGVIRACAEPRPGKTPLTWITPQIMRAYHNLHLAGYAHSVEVWDSEHRLVGGVYGVALGQVFFGESQFATVGHASKVAVAVLHDHLARWGFVLRDAKHMTAHLETLGFKPMTRDEFLCLLKVHANKPDRRGKWQVEAPAAKVMPAQVADVRMPRTTDARQAA